MSELSSSSPSQKITTPSSETFSNPYFNAYPFPWFSEYESMIKTMQKENPNASKILKNNSYHKYAQEIIKSLKKKD